MLSEKDVAIKTLSSVKDLRTIMTDNGKGFIFNVRKEEGLESFAFFAKPCLSRERGINEITNGLIRQNSRKTQTSQSSLQDMSNWRNARQAQRTSKEKSGLLFTQKEVLTNNQSRLLDSCVIRLKQYSGVDALISRRTYS